MLSIKNFLYISYKKELKQMTTLRVIFKDDTTALYTGRSYYNLKRDKSVKAIKHDRTNITLYKRGK